MSNSYIQALTIILINEFGTSTVQIPSIEIVKLKPKYNNVLVLLDLEEDVCLALDQIYAHFLLGVPMLGVQQND